MTITIISFTIIMIKSFITRISMITGTWTKARTRSWTNIRKSIITGTIKRARTKIRKGIITGTSTRTNTRPRTRTRTTTSKIAGQGKDQGHGQENVK